MANPNYSDWDIVTGKMSKDALEQFRKMYKQRQVPPTQPIAALPMPTSLFSPEQITAAQKDAGRPAAPDMSNILYNVPQGNTPKDPGMAAGALGALGAMGTTMANIKKPDVGLGALSGAATGAGYGAMFGPVGMAVGAVVGGIGGLVSTGINRSKYDEAKLSAEKGKIRAATVFGSDIGEFEGGGNVGGEEGGLTPIQTSKGETITLIDGSIYKTKSTKTHKQMPSGLITDILPPDAYVASASKKISKAKADKMILGYDTIEYTEEGNSSMPNKNTLGDMMSKKTMTSAELMLIIKNKFPTNDLEMDPFARRAKVANLKSRLPYINAIIAASE